MTHLIILIGVGFMIAASYTVLRRVANPVEHRLHLSADLSLEGIGEERERDQPMANGRRRPAQRASAPVRWASRNRPPAVPEWPSGPDHMLIGSANHMFLGSITVSIT